MHLQELSSFRAAVHNTHVARKVFSYDALSLSMFWRRETLSWALLKGIPSRHQAIVFNISTLLNEGLGSVSSTIFIACIDGH
jgi:hypothetical protein